MDLYTIMQEHEISVCNIHDGHLRNTREKPWPPSEISAASDGTMMFTFIY